MMNEYQQQIIDLYQNPLNFGTPKEFSHSFKLSNLSCGDEIEVYLTVKKGKVTDAQFVGAGCSISIASASLLTDFIVGKKLTDIIKLNEDDILDLLGIPLTTARLKCALLPLESTKKALKLN